MEVKQVYEYVNEATKRALGDGNYTLAEDLTGIVDVGTALYNANAVENFTRTLVDKIGRTIFVDRVYKGDMLSILKTKVEYGSVTEKISGEIPDAEENESWELMDGASYDPNIFYGSKVNVKFFNGKKSFEIPISITDRQLKSAFTNAETMIRFVSMLFNNVSKSMTIKTEQLIKATIQNMIGETIYNEYQGTDKTLKSGARAVNLLKLYKDETGDNSVTATNYMIKPEFIRYAVSKIADYMRFIKSPSRIFNIGGKVRFTTEEYLHLILLSQFKNKAKVYLESNTFNKELVALPNSEEVTYWSGTGTGYELAETSKVKVKTSENHDVDVTNVIGVLFDVDALGVQNEEPRITSQYNAKAEFTNYWHKWDANYFNDFDENFVVFFVA